MCGGNARDRCHVSKSRDHGVCGRGSASSCRLECARMFLRDSGLACETEVQAFLSRLNASAMPALPAAGKHASKGTIAHLSSCWRIVKRLSTTSQQRCLLTYQSRCVPNADLFTVMLISRISTTRIKDVGHISEDLGRAFRPEQCPVCKRFHERTLTRSARQHFELAPLSQLSGVVTQPHHEFLFSC